MPSALLEGLACNVLQIESIYSYEILLQWNLLKDFMWFTSSEITERSWHSYSQPGSSDLHILSLPFSEFKCGIHITIILLLIFFSQFCFLISDYAVFPFSKFLLFLILCPLHFIKVPITFWIHEEKLKINHPFLWLVLVYHINLVWDISSGQIQDLLFYSNLHFLFLLILTGGFYDNNLLSFSM